MNIERGPPMRCFPTLWESIDPLTLACIPPNDVLGWFGVGRWNKCCSITVQPTTYKDDDDDEINYKQTNKTMID